MTLEVRLLGAIEAYRGGERVELRGGQLRTLVAYLALVPGTSRSIDGIVDALWPEAERGGAMAADPRQAVHTYASRARRALGPDSVVARDGGYALVVGPLDLDVWRFESLVRSAADPGCSVARKVELLEEGLALWRGAALDGMHDREWARPDAVRLEEMRAIAQDDRGEALLALGDALAAVPLLTAAASTSPLRERTHALLMTALHHCGRQAEALRVFQQFRHRLGTDLGLEPGDAITGLERSIASGERAVPDVASGGRVVPGYVLHERIGDGMFAVVYRGRQPSVERDVAIKVIRAELANRPEFVRRFEAEAQLVANLEHPHIVPLYDFWRAPGSAYLVMRLFPTGTLEHRISNGPLELRDVTRLVSQIGAAIATAHAAGIVHRDVKPANICLDAQGNFYLGDFGIAHEAMSILAETDSLPVGSPRYASPEQLRGEPVGLAADVHGLAITVFESLSGRSPYADARTQPDLLHRQLNEPLPPLPPMPGRAAPDVVARLDSVLARAAAKDAAQRHSSVDELVADFLRAAGSVEALESNRHRQPWAPGEGVLRNPYKGLRPFDEADASDFFGRAHLVDRLIERMGGGDFEGRMLTVVGPSGSGKSSVVRAGLVPRLRGGAVIGAAEWFITTMLPGAHPFEELEAALGRIATTPVGGTAESMASERRGIARAVRRLLPDANGELLLVIDQFEELFTLCVDPQERDRFIAGLVEAVTEPRSRLRLVATLRADFFDRPLRHPELATLVERSAVAVTPLAADELESAITEPGYRAGVQFEPGLVTRVVADVVDQPGALPLLQYALTELFDRHEAGVLTIEAYEALGGLTGALAQRGEQLYTNASEGEQAAIRRMFTRLVSLGEGTEDTRRRVRRPELGTGPDTQSVVDRYGAVRLLSFDRDPLTREQTVEVAHEALLREWPRLRLWLDEDRDGLRLQRHITTSTSAWEASGRDDGELYRGGRLEAAAHWVGDHPDDLNESERAFVATSEALHRSTELSKVRSARRLRRALVAVAAVAVVALIAGGLAWRQQRAATTSQRAAAAAARDATEQRDAATAAATEAERLRQAAEDSSAEAEQQRQAAVDTAYVADTERMAALAPTLVETDPSLAMVLAAEANSRSNDPRTQGALQRVLVDQSTLGFIRPGYRVTQAGFDTAGNIVTFGNKQIDVWDATTHHRVDSIAVPEPQHFLPNGPSVQPIAIGGDLVAWMDPDRELWVADLRTGAVERQFPTDVVGVGIDAPRRQIGVVTADGDVLIFTFGETAPRWTATGDGFRTLAELAGPDLGLLCCGFDALPPAGAVVFNTSGTKVYVSRSKGVRVLDTSSGAELANVPYAGRSFGTAQFLAPLASDDSRVVISDAAGAALVDTDDPSAQPTPIELAPTSPTWETFAATGGDTFAAVELDGRVTVFDVAGDIVLGPVNLDVGRSRVVTLAPDGRSIAVAGETGVELLALDGSALMHTTASVPAEHVHALAVTDELIYSSESATDTGDLFRGGTGTYTRCRPGCAVSNETPRGGVDFPFQAVNGWIPVMSLTSSGYEWRIYDRAGRLHATGTSTTLALPGGVFVPRSGNWIALLFYLGAGTLEVRSLPDWTLLKSQPLKSSVQIAGSAEPDQLLVFNDFIGSSELLDTTTWELTPSPMGSTDVVDARFSPDGRWLVTASGRGDLTIRDPSTFDPVKVLSGSGAAGNGLWASSLAVSDDSRFILSAVDGRARLWDVATGEPIGDPVGVAGGPPWSSVVSGDTPKYITLADGKLRILSFDVDQYREMACQAAGRNMTREEWDLYGPRNEAYHATCAQWPAEYSYCQEVQSCFDVASSSRT